MGTCFERIRKDKAWVEAYLTTPAVADPLWDAASAGPVEMPPSKTRQSRLTAACAKGAGIPHRRWSAPGAGLGAAAVRSVDAAMYSERCKTLLQAVMLDSPR